MKAGGLLEINPLLTDRVRISIMAALMVSKEGTGFMSLAESLNVSKGNLSAHLRKLEDQALIEVTKSFVDRKPLSTYRCSKKGRDEFTKYLKSIELVLHSIQKAKKG